MKSQAIGIFDSGIGGFTVVKEIIKLLLARKPPPLHNYEGDSSFCDPEVVIPRLLLRAPKPS